MDYRIIHYDELDSTNAEAKRMIDPQEGTVIVAERQTAGRGRLGRAWESPCGVGIYMTVILSPNVGAKVTLAAGLAVSRALRKYTNPMIKWPNDVYVDGKKICGILTEMVSEADIPKTVICGVGVNVNNEQFETPDATSLYLETGVKYDVGTIMTELLDSFSGIYEEFRRDSGSILKEYESQCLNILQDVELDGENYTVVGVHESGGLVMRGESGVERVVM